MFRLFGWSYPPGVSRVPGDEDTHCDVCFKSTDECVCHECPHCGGYGDSDCYKNHEMRLTKVQLVARQEVIVSRAKEKVKEAESDLKSLIAKDDPFALDSDGGEPWDRWSDRLEDAEDPFSIKLRYS